MPRTDCTRWKIGGLCLLLAGSVFAADPTADPAAPTNNNVAGNAEVERILKEFPGRGELGDDTPPTPAETAVTQFILPDDLKMELVGAEPAVEQPLFMHFDPKGRLWVVQYRQYPFPEGLKVIHYDQHLRAVFDKVPEPPPRGARGKDKITVFEDTNGDGQYDTHRDVITGLNITSSVVVGQGGIWVLNPPYLLFYPDADDDAVPDGDPEVHLSGFGLEDTHSVANSLSWGTDGWLYGANGSTTTGNVSSRVTRNVKFEGQCIWRYHPRTHVFEIYAEGGGNTFSTEVDAGGRLFSGTNHGNTRGMFYPQGSYGTKNWGKHGPLTNPYAFGYFEHMPHEGDKDRFAQTFVIYEGASLPERYRGQVIAANALHNRVWASSLEPMGSTYHTKDLPPVVTTPDRWFRPVDLKVGPDGAVYLADWYDTRLSHVDPRDTWHKTTGRIYRIVSKNGAPDQPTNLSGLSNAQLIELFSSPGKWQQQTAVRVLAERLQNLPEKQAQPLVQQLRSLAQDSQPETPSLQALWTLAQADQVEDELLAQVLDHPQPDVRRWGLRLLGDRRRSTAPLTSILQRLATDEQQVQVLSQLLSTVRRLPTEDAVQVLPALLARADFQDDPHLPLLLWWAIESHCAADRQQLTPQVAVPLEKSDQQLPSPREQIVALFESPDLWRTPGAQRVVLHRLMQRFALESVLAAERGQGNSAEVANSSLSACVRLFELAQTPEDREQLMSGFLDAYEGRNIATLPDVLKQRIMEHQKQLGQSDLVLSIKLGDAAAIGEALKVVRNESANSGTRLAYIELLGQSRKPEVLGTLLGLLGSPSPGVKRVALSALMNFDDPKIGQTICSRWQSTITEEHNLRGTALRVLASRPVWTQQLLKEIDEFRIKAGEVPLDIVQQMRLHDVPEIQTRLDKYWGKTRATPEEKQQLIARIRDVVRAGPGKTAADPHVGHELFKKTCATCHTLFDEGGQTGPNLTGYERDNLDFMLLAMVDPSAAIREEFTQYQIALEDGRILTGLIVDQSPTTVVLRGANNQSTTLNKAEIEVLQAMSTSIMPDGLLEKLSDDEIRHLFSYLIRRTPLTN
ncbi:MAG: c-type cytochrome [Planctomycetaceae bacterium]|nr:c-type cytochrome [Planctomycetaceae bacterium]